MLRRSQARAADELQYDLAPVRPQTMFGKIDALPGAEREFCIEHRYMQRHTREHGLHVRRHVVRALDIMHPAGIDGREAIERGAQIGAHVGIGVLLDHQGCGRVAEIEEQHAVPGLRLSDEAHRIAGDLGKALPAGFDLERRSCDQAGRSGCNHGQAASATGPA